MGTFGKNVQSNHPSRKEDKGSHSWEFCSAEAAPAWPWSVLRGSAGEKWRERTGDSSNREKSPFYLPGLTRWGHSGGRVRLEKPIITALSLSFWTLGDREVPRSVGQPAFKVGQRTPAYWEPELSVWPAEYNRILITHFPPWIAHFGGNQVLYQANLWRRPCGEERRSAKTHWTSALVESCSSSCLQVAEAPDNSLTMT